MNRLRLCWRQAMHGNFKPARVFGAHALYGLTHAHCKRCGVRKGFTTRKICDACAVKNLLRAVFEELG